MEFTFINKNTLKHKKKINYKLPHILDQKSTPTLKSINLPERFYK